MFTLHYPWLLLLLLLPPVARLIVPPYRESQLAIRTPWFSRMPGLFGVEPGEGAVIHETGRLERTFNGLFWLLIVLALARPQYLEEPIVRVMPTRDILLVVDLSGSMETVDFKNGIGEKVDRLTAVKEVLDTFLTKRKGDRVGIIVFGNAAFVQVPFTLDLEACRILLSEMAPRMAGPKTAFGDAIGLGITLFEQSEVDDRVMIVLTDGNDTGSKVPPEEGAKIAHDKDIVIHVVGVGDPTAVGEGKFDEEALQAVAAHTGGNYYFAADREKLETIYLELDAISTREIETESYRPRIDIFYWPLGLFMILSLLFSFVKLLRKHLMSIK